MFIEFYEKPGCVNNTKQKQLLISHGHTVISYSILTHKWEKDSLRLFFGNMPVADWFNKAAPRVKSGEVIPENYNEQLALEAMISDPLLIRRPLIRVGEHSVCGFDNEFVNKLIENSEVSHLQSCPNLNNSCK